MNSEALSHKPLIATFSFWCALLLPIASGFALGVGIYLSTSLGGVCFSSGCVNHFVEVFKVPLSIASISLPLVAMVAAIQRSNEASLQIRYSSAQYGESISNNRIGNFIKHRDGFIAMIEDFCSAESNDVARVSIDADSLYFRIFPKNGFGFFSYEVSEESEYVTHLNMHIKNMEQCINTGLDDLERFDLQEFMRCYVVMSQILFLKFSPSSMFVVEGGNDHVVYQVKSNSTQLGYTFSSVYSVWVLCSKIRAYGGGGPSLNVDYLLQQNHGKLIASGVNKITSWDDYVKKYGLQTSQS
ncbi:hypothetical protein N5E96_20435 [Pseudomonas mosselii]|uniref:hypothetical protein n=1 Tax=Pseudomonas mosselii TaxID=78327 RepID=UPI00244BC591|nr:hypothetical protein [Pseudomonas mosselii]MDH1657057.1 hypothetical protein [Pseudomonas mosselii]MDH1718551.1 hypothetical protein [Pseudomonas mosselii]MDH1723660.1 hypothetical protein [Pseudomonas mosselii]